MIERLTHKLEDRFRTVARSSTEYATNRAQVFSLRARSLYLRGQYQEGHRILNLALSDLGEQDPARRFCRAAIEVYRAELDWISAHDYILRYGPEKFDSSMKKLDSAVACLDAAAKWLVDDRSSFCGQVATCRARG